MNNKVLSSAILAAVVAAPAAWAEVTTKSGTWSGQVTSVDVESTGNTTVIYRRHDQEPWGDHMPFQLGEGAISFTWDSDKPDS